MNQDLPLSRVIGAWNFLACVLTVSSLGIDETHIANLVCPWDNPGMSRDNDIKSETSSARTFMQTNWAIS
jgi:hypothetical protein